MNTGVCDAHNLAWKLAAVLQGAASPRLLDSYTPERKPVGLANMQLSADNFYEELKVPSVGGLQGAGWDHAVLCVQAHCGCRGSFQVCLEGRHFAVSCQSATQNSFGLQGWPCIHPEFVRGSAWWAAPGLKVVCCITYHAVRGRLQSVVVQ